jgi:UDPglucose--hexose-1-phosphate uridylyltransferase
MSHLGDVAGKWEKRWHPLREEWVVYAAHRNNRPWSFDKKERKENLAPSYDPFCYLCPGNVRISGIRNPDYKDVYIFDNDHPVVGLDAPSIDPGVSSLHHGLFKRAEAKGIARVVCYDPRHNVTLSEVEHDAVTRVFLAWREETKAFLKNPKISYALIFENKGELVGVSNPHPHCQIYATDFTFNTIERELNAAEKYHSQHQRNLFLDIIDAEQKEGIRIIAENQNAIAFVPFFARYAYEVHIYPKKKHATLATMSDTELHDLAQVYQTVIRKYDVNFNMSFPYVMTINQAPLDGGTYNHYQCHLIFLPPLRLPGLVKYLGGPESGGGNFMADTMPEDKAQELIKADISNFKSL